MPSNPAGIDLGDGLFWDALGLTDNSWVTVDYLWTGSIRLSAVVADEPVDVLAAPDAAAEVVGVAADRAALPVECALTVDGDTWLRIGVDQYVSARSVPGTTDAEACTAAPPAGASGPDAPTGDAPGDAAGDDASTGEAPTGDTLAAPAATDPAAPAEGAQTPGAPTDDESAEEGAPAGYGAPARAPSRAPDAAG
jgi:hypothetical protein